MCPEGPEGVAYKIRFFLCPPAPLRDPVSLGRMGRGEGTGRFFSGSHPLPDRTGVSSESKKALGKGLEIS